MNATPGPILPKICDWMLNKNYESHTRSQTIENCFQFPSFRHRVKAITRESRTLPTEQRRQLRVSKYDNINKQLTVQRDGAARACMV